MESVVLKEEISVREAFMIIDGWKSIIEKLLCILPETENGLKSYLYIHVIMPLKKAVDYYDEYLNGIYSGGIN